MACTVKSQRCNSICSIAQQHTHASTSAQGWGTPCSSATHSFPHAVVLAQFLIQLLKDLLIRQHKYKDSSHDNVQRKGKGAAPLTICFGVARALRMGCVGLSISEGKSFTATCTRTRATAIKVNHARSSVMHTKEGNATAMPPTFTCPTTCFSTSSVDNRIEGGGI